MQALGRSRSTSSRGTSRSIVESEVTALIASRSDAVILESLQSTLKQEITHRANNTFLA